MKITGIEAIALAAPFAEAFGGLENVPPELLRPAANQVATPRRGQFSTIVRVHTDEGLEGIGEAFGLPAPEITATIVARHFRPLLLGRDPLETTVLWELAYGAQRGGGQTAGFMLEALSGIDTALWDIKGKALGLPVAQLLGGAFRDRVPVYASPVPFLPTPEESARGATAFVGQGFRGVKLKVGRGVAVDVDHVAAVREAISPEVDLMLDLNCAYDARTAVALARQVLPYDVFWIEEPVPPEDLDGLAEVHRRAEMPVVTGESVYTAFAMRDILVRGAADSLQPNVAKAGGITECSRIGDLARLFNVSIAPHGVGSGLAIAAALQWCASLPNLLVYEANRFFNPLREAVITEKIEIENGCLVVPPGPGLGVSLDEEGMAPYVVGRF